MRAPRGFSPSGDFLHRRLAPGLDLFLHPTPRFKTVLVRAYLLQPLAEEPAAALSLAAAVLKQGSADHPDRMLLYGALDGLYGADLDLDTLRIGEAHLLEADLTLPAERFSGERGVIGKGLSILAGVLGKPLEEGKGFPRAAFRQERGNLKDAIAAVLNHKPAYATLQCLRLVCRSEPYRIGRYGTPAALDRLRPEGLLASWRDAAARFPVAVYAAGAFEAEAMAGRIADALLPLRRGRPLPRPGGGFRRDAPARPLLRTERAPVTQARLCLAYRANTAWGKPGFGALALAQTVLGGGSHAKLFQEVREKASLAYDAYASLERTKGLLLIGAGVEPSRRDRAEAIILAQVAAVQAGRISRQEWRDSRVTLINRLRCAGDSPGRLVAMHLEGWVNGRPIGVRRALEEIRAVTPDQAAAAARRWAHAATYCLTDRRHPS